MGNSETFVAVAASGNIAVRTTELGQPVRLRIRQEELNRHPAHLAAEIVLLCRQAADRAALLRRAALEAAGMSAAALAATGLPTRDEVAAAELAYDQQFGAEPQIWVRPN
ncbi:hypothetical protein ACFWUP_20710 [Nocardia sp. NPDC058658]|uniref:hypothetical protein n=1 Tax=Nocardia sp. NPDC058658 TaxID=3346580 RepID=UPI00365E217E